MTTKTIISNTVSSLLTDLYQLTMAYAYFKSGLSSHEAVFHLSFRKNPFSGGFAISCGLDYVIDFLENFSFTDEDLDYLGTITGSDGKVLFDNEFLNYLRNLKFECDVLGVEEGTVVFAYEPLIRVQGPIIQAQMLETILLNIINFQTLIATKAARICIAAKDEPVIEFGLRRAQGFDGALVASRASYIGGCSATSNVLAGKVFHIPVRGTHAHSWIMVFDDELEAFKTYARIMPNNSVLLVDTFNTIEGVKKAVEAAKLFKDNGFHLSGIRLDSGDLAYLSIEARKILDEAGYEDTKIIASNDLDEVVIESLKNQGAKINVWGVGTKLVTGGAQGALDGVYKLSAIRNKGGEWKYRVKISDQSAKVSNPGIQQVRRYFSEKENIADAIYEESTDLSKGCLIIDPEEITRRKKIPANLNSKDLLIPIFKKGKLVYKSPDIHEIRNKVKSNLNMFHPGIKRFVNPHRYPVGLEKSLYELKTSLILKLKEQIAC